MSSTFESRAVNPFRRRNENPSETFTVEDGYLVHAVVPGYGEPYRHTCDRPTFEEVCHTIDERAPGEQICLQDLMALMPSVPSTRIAVAYSFLKERGIVVPGSRRMSRVNPGQTAHLDGLLEFECLAHTARTGELV